MEKEEMDRNNPEYGLASEEQMDDDARAGKNHLDRRDDRRVKYCGKETKSDGKKLAVLECEDYTLRLHKTSGGYLDIRTIKIPGRTFAEISHEIQIKQAVNKDYRVEKGDFVYIDINKLEEKMQEIGKVSRIEMILDSGGDEQ